MNNHSLNFKTLKKPKTPNYYLVSPKDFCPFAPNKTSPIYNIDHRKLYVAWAKMITQQPRTDLILIDEKQMQYQYVQRSRLFRFPDYINVEFIPLSIKTSTLAIFSQSKYGYIDFGANETRIKHWLNALSKSLA